MPAATRVTDETVGTCNPGYKCCPHSRNGINTQGSPNVFINDLDSHRLTDDGDCRCPHGGTYDSTQGSPNVFVNGLAKTRINDETTCQNCGVKGHHITGSPNVFIN